MLVLNPAYPGSRQFEPTSARPASRSWPKEAWLQDPRTRWMTDLAEEALAAVSGVLEQGKTASGLRRKLSWLGKLVGQTRRERRAVGGFTKKVRQRQQATV